MYQALYMPNQLIYGSGEVVVVAGWSDRKAIAKSLVSTDYAAIGQLFSPTRGISFLIRNLLWNPFVTDLVVLNATRQDVNAGAAQALNDFFLNGIEEGISDSGRSCWLIKSDIKGFIDIEIPKEALEALRVEVACHFFTSKKDAVEKIKTLSSIAKKPHYSRLQMEFPLHEVAPTILPGERYGHIVRGSTIAETWVKLIHLIKTTGHITPSGYDDDRQELIDVLAVVESEPDDFHVPDYLPCDRDAIANYIPLMLEDSPYKEGVKYTYAQRLRSWFGRDQVEQVIQKLVGEIDTASAVMSLWDSGGILHSELHPESDRQNLASDHESGGSPCLNHIWVRVLNESELSLTAVFRSHDMFNGWPVNAFGLRSLQQFIRDRINEQTNYSLSLGPMVIVSQSAHIYASTWEYADRLISEQYVNASRAQYKDPVGNFIISRSNEQIYVQLTTPGSGEVVKEFTGKNPLKLAEEICKTTPGIQTSHAAYLGMELQKASMLENYEQDKDPRTIMGSKG